MELLELAICKYYDYSHVILNICGFLLVIKILIAVFFLKEKTQYFLNRIFYNVVHIFAMILAGQVCAVLKLCPKIAYVHFNVWIFAVSVIGVVGYCLFEGVIFRKIRIQVLRICKMIKVVTLGEIFLLAITCHLELFEGITATLLIVWLDMISILVGKMDAKKEQEISNESDYSNPNLFPTREKQLEKFLPVLEQQKEEPYAIMISGEWGAGKSSFVKALEKKLPKDVFIWIRTGGEKSVSEIMMEISERILGVLKENNILIEKDALIEKYFMAFSDFLGTKGIQFFRSVLGLVDNNTKVDLREYVNTKLEDLDKTIYLIVDDLDRCDKEYQDKMFKVIRESTDLKHCKTIFLVDKAQFQIGDEHYIEKYISYTLDLCDVSCGEILNHVFNDIMDAEFIQSMDAVLLKDRNADTVKKMICALPEQILSTLQAEISKTSDSIKAQKSEGIDSQKNENKMAELTDTKLTIKRNTINARKLKSFLKGIKREIVYMNKSIASCSEEFRKEDWLKAMIEVQFLKSFLPKLYADMKMCNDIYEFDANYNGYSQYLIMEIKHGFWMNKGNKPKILNDIIYHIDVIDFRQMQTEREKYLGELHQDATFEHISEYVKYAYTDDDFDKIVELCENQGFRNIEMREEFLTGMLGALGQLPYTIKINNSKLADLSERLLKCIRQWGISEKEKKICSEKGQLIIRRMIIGNIPIFRNILMMLFRVTDVQNNWDTLDASGANEFYYMLKRLDSHSIQRGLDDEANKVRSIEKYFGSLKEELLKEKYADSGLDFEQIFRELDIVFKTCLLWDDVECQVGAVLAEESPLFEKYFDSEVMNTYKEVAFSDCMNLQNALQALNEFYESKTAECCLRYASLLISLLLRMLSQWENDSTWFEGEEKKLGDSLEEVAEKFYKLDQTDSHNEDDILDYIRVLVYKFKRYCSDCESDCLQ